MAIPPIKGQGLRGLVVSPEELFEDPSICASNRPSSEAYLKQEFESLNTGGDPDGPVAKLEGFKPSIRGSRENPPIMRYPQNIGSPDSGLPHVMQFKVYWRWENTELIMEQTKKLKAEAEAALEQLVEATDLIANEDYNYENILAKSTSDVPTKLLFDPAFVDPKDPSSKRNLYTMLNNPETREEAKAIMERNVRSATDRTEYIGRLSANRDTSNNFGATDITRDDDVLSGRLNKSISGTEDQASIAGAAEAIGLKQRDPQYDQMISVYLPICTRINSEDTFTYTDADMKLVGGVASAINSALGSEDFMGSLAESGKQAALGYASKLGEGTAYAGIMPKLS